MDVHTSISTGRMQLLDAAIQQWTKSLVDTGKRNPLLYYRDLRSGTLNLKGASSAGVARLLSGDRVASSSLYPEEVPRLDAHKRLGAIRKRVVELQEERGLQTGYLAYGLATWQEDESPGPTRAPAAPVVLCEVTISPKSAAQDDFYIQLGEEAEVNPVLLHFLAEERGTPISSEDLPDIIEGGDRSTLQSVGERLEELCKGIRGFHVEPAMVIGTFAYQKLPMVNDLKEGLELLAESEVVAALAGDREAQVALRNGAGHAQLPELSQPDHTAPADEYLVLDADSSQNYAINAVRAGQNVVIKGPPGTGKSQTISNLVATLMARGQTVLFVAEKRAALDAVLQRLNQVGLGTWVMDLHEGVSSRRRVAQQLAETLDQAATSAQPALNGVHRELTSSRERLLAHQKLMHDPRAPWNISVFEAQSRLMAKKPLDITFRIRHPELSRMTDEVLEEVKQALTEYVDLGGSVLAVAMPWNVAAILSRDNAREALGSIQQLVQHTVPQAIRAMQGVPSEIGLPAPRTVWEWGQLIDLLRRTSEVMEVLSADVFDQDIDVLVAATATRKWRREHNVSLKGGERRRLTRSARSFCLGGPLTRTALHCTLTTARDLRQKWWEIRTTEVQPRLPKNFQARVSTYEQLVRELEDVGAYLHPEWGEFSSLDLHTGVRKRLNTLMGEQHSLTRLPRRHELRTYLETACGLGPLLQDFQERELSAVEASEVLETIWLRSILDEIALVDANYSSFEGASLDRTVEAYQEADQKHIRTTTQRIQRRNAENLYATLDGHPEQGVLLRKEANRKRGHLSLRALIDQAPEVLPALKPCWAMSPLVVSQVLPLRRSFDVVIFDEASQIPPADAIPAIARAQRIVVAGDERQLPPTNFFESLTVEEDADGELEDPALTTGVESILDSLAPVVPTRTLEWHYRSRDERLIAFSNAHIYDSMLTTFPGALVDGVLEHVHVPWVPGPSRSGTSSAAEVRRVADFVIEHAQKRPSESLGVITMGIEHANRIEAEVRHRLKDRRDFEEFFSEAREERFFVKNLERVQGDERDAIILSIGYGKGPDGRMHYRFGPINQDGGERRLNVAVSRAKRRMTLVSSFTSADLDPKKLRSRGAELLGAFVAFMESGGADLGSFSAVPPELNPFERDVRDRLTAVGLNLTAQYGASGYKIDFVASYPDEPGRLVLAIEADGASYHASPTARDRDRLRQAHLENLGWRFHRIWSTDWFQNPDREVEKVLASFKAAVRAVDSGESRPLHVATEPPIMGLPEGARSGPCPLRGGGAPITEYRRSQLIELIRWIESDGLLRTEDDLISEAVAVLGYKRRGSRIVTALKAAVKAGRG